MTRREQVQQNPLPDHLVGDREKPRRHGEAERFCGLEVDHELEFGRSQHRQIRRPLTFENASDMGNPGVQTAIERKT